HYGVPAGSCLLVGDTFHDVLAAAAAGVRSAVVRNPALTYRPDGADYYLDALTGAFDVSSGCGIGRGHGSYHRGRAGDDR
ncbi:MAG: HAD hydrolase-like protein, partial [Sciscionella sp.]